MQTVPHLQQCLPYDLLPTRARARRESAPLQTLSPHVAQHLLCRVFLLLLDTEVFRHWPSANQCPFSTKIRAGVMVGSRQPFQADLTPTPLQRPALLKDIASRHRNRRLSPERLVNQASSHERSILVARLIPAVQAMKSRPFAFLLRTQSLQAQSSDATMTARQVVDRLMVLPRSLQKILRKRKF